MMFNFIVRGVIRPATWNLIQLAAIGIAIIYLEMVMLAVSNTFFHYIVLPLSFCVFLVRCLL